MLPPCKTLYVTYTCVKTQSHMNMYSRLVHVHVYICVCLPSPCCPPWSAAWWWQSWALTGPFHTESPPTSLWWLPAAEMNDRRTEKQSFYSKFKLKTISINNLSSKFPRCVCISTLMSSLLASCSFLNLYSPSQGLTAEGGAMHTHFLQSVPLVTVSTV